MLINLLNFTTVKTNRLLNLCDDKHKSSQKTLQTGTEICCGYRVITKSGWGEEAWSSLVWLQDRDR